MLKKFLYNYITSDHDDTIELTFSISFILAVISTLILFILNWRTSTTMELCLSGVLFLIIGTIVLVLTIISIKTILSHIIKVMYNK